MVEEEGEISILGTRFILFLLYIIELVEGKNAPHPGDINQALIELGSTICKVRDPSCKSCPLRPWCSAYTLASQPDSLVRHEVLF